MVSHLRELLETVSRSLLRLMATLAALEVFNILTLILVLVILSLRIDPMIKAIAIVLLLALFFACLSRAGRGR